MQKKKKPNFNPNDEKSNLLESVIPLYQEGLSLRKIGLELNLSPQKVKKLLVSAGVYQSDTVKQVNVLYSTGLSITEIQERTGLSIASINTCIPYGKVVYKMSETSVDADRARLFRQRHKVVEHVKKSIAFGEENLQEAVWDAIAIFAGYPFQTMKGLRFTYQVSGGEIFFTRKEKSVTRAIVDLAIERITAAKRKGKIIKGPKDIGVFGDSYLYPVLVRIGVVYNPKESSS